MITISPKEFLNIICRQYDNMIRILNSYIIVLDNQENASYDEPEGTGDIQNVTDEVRNK